MKYNVCYDLLQVAACETFNKDSVGTVLSAEDVSKTKRAKALSVEVYHSSTSTTSTMEININNLFLLKSRDV